MARRSILLWHTPAREEVRGMLKLLKRLDRLTDTMVDADALLSAKGGLRPVQIKAIFDNLRYYAALGFMWVGVKLLWGHDEWHAAFSAAALAAVTIALGILVALQTAYIFLTLTFVTTSALLPPRVAVRLRRGVRTDDWKIKTAAVLLACVIAGAMIVIASALLEALSRTGFL